jgi:hypothetical protein
MTDAVDEPVLAAGRERQHSRKRSNPMANPPVNSVSVQPPTTAAEPLDSGRIPVIAPRISLTIYVKTGPKCSMATTDAAAEGHAPVETARDELQDAVPKAAETLTDLLDADDERVQIRAAEAILDRAGLTKADKYSTKQAQVQIGGGERSGRGINRTDPLEDADESDPAAEF